MKLWNAVGALVALSLLLGACTVGQPEPTTAPSPTSVSPPTATPTSPAAATGAPTPRPSPTFTPRPGATPTPQLVSTPTPGATTTPQLVPTPRPTLAPAVTPAAETQGVTCPVEGHPSTTSAAGAAPLPPAPTANETRVAIDGLADDWAGRASLPDDTAGDAEAGFLDLTTGYAFINEHALYLRVDAADRSAPFEQVEIRLQAGPRLLWVGWAPVWDRPFVVDTTTEWNPIGDAFYSTLALGSALEGRLDLRDLGSPESLSVIRIDVMVGECCGPTWRPADTWTPATAPPVVDEVDPAWRLALRGGAREAERTLAAPDTRAIALDYDPATRRVRVTGAAGAVPEGTKLLVGNLELNDFMTLNADSLGAFETEVVGAPGSHVLIKQDVTGRIIRSISTIGENNIAPGVLLRIPVAAAPEGIAFGAAARLCCNNEQSATWALEGVYERDALEPGTQFRISGRLSLLADSSTQPPVTELDFFAYLLGDASGRQVGRAGKFVTAFLTPTGLPIERTLDGPPLGRMFPGRDLVTWELDGERWVADFATVLRVPRDARTGLYTLTAGNLWSLQDIQPAGSRPFTIVIRDQAAHQPILGTFTVGNPAPMRLSTTLLADDVSEGSHGGVLAREDRALFGISGRAATRHDPVIPRLDGYGQPWAYRLDPYMPMIDVVDRSLPNSPAIALDFSDSELTIAIARPDGETDVLGPAPLARYAVKSPRTPWNLAMGLGGGELREIAQLLGDGDTFAYRFPMDGDYVVTLDGHIADYQGRRNEICGTYDVTVANVLDIETALLPGTPFEVGNSIAPTLTVMPGVPAQVTYTITNVAADGESTTETFSGHANRFGWWDGGGAVWTFQHHGEYRIDVEARYAAPDGDLWVGRLRFGSAVATPNAPIIAHGRRGSDGLTEISRPWGFERDFVYDEGAVAPHMFFPYFTGDILWGTERLHEERANTRNAGTAVVTDLSFQSLEDNHPLVARTRRQAERYVRFTTPSVAEMIQAGQIPLVTAPETANQNSGLGAHPDEIDLWAYAVRLGPAARRTRARGPKRGRRLGLVLALRRRLLSPVRQWPDGRPARGLQVHV